MWVANVCRSECMPRPLFMQAFFSDRKHLLGRGFTEVFFRILAGKQPFAGMILTPIGSQIRKQFFGKNRVAVLFTLALLDPDQHSVRIAFDVVRFKTNQFTDPKTCTVYGLQQKPVFKIIRCSQQAFYFLRAKDSR